MVFNGTKDLMGRILDSIKDMPTQTLLSLVALRQDTLRELSQEISEVNLELESIHLELERRKV